MLTVEHLSIVNRKPGINPVILENVNLTIHENKVIALAGQSGSGKTLLSLSIAGLSRYIPSIKVTGNVYWNGIELLATKEGELRKKVLTQIAFIWQHPMSSFNPLLKLKSQLPTLAGNTSSHQNEVVAAMKHFVKEAHLPDFENLLNSYPHQLSTGQLQRILVALAIARKPAIIVTDEATASLDTTSTETIMSMLAEYQKKSKCIWILITHNENQINSFADEIINLDNFKSVNFGKPGRFSDLTETKLRTVFKPNEDKISPGDSIQKKPLVTLRNVSFAYPSKQLSDTNLLLDNITFSFLPGKFYGLMGDSGAGKSTLAKLLMGELQPTSGNIQWNFDSNSENNRSYYRKKTALQLIYQDALQSMDPGMRVDLQLKEVAKYIAPWKSFSTKLEQLTKLLQKAGFEWGDLSKLPGNFSGGQLQRIVMVRSLLAEPEFIIFDETLSALDEQSKHDIANLINKYYETNPFTALWISHDETLLKKLCSQIIQLKNNKLSLLH